MALAAAEETFGPGPHALEKVSFQKGLVLPEEGARTVQLVISPEMPGTVSFQVFSLPAGETEQPASWTLHATETIRLGKADRAASRVEHVSLEEIRARCSEVVSGAEHYRALQDRGLEYGACFQGVEQIWRQDGEALGRLRLPERMESEASAYQVHPALLDASFQVLAAALPGVDARITGEDTYLPVGLGSLRVYERPHPGVGLWSHALLRPGAEANADTLEGDVFLLDENGQVMLEVLGLRLARLDRDAVRSAHEEIGDWLYEIQWRAEARSQQDPAADPLSPDEGGRWLLFTDCHGVGQTLRSLLEARGQSCVVVSPGETYEVTGPGQYRLDPSHPEEFRQLLGDAFGSGQPACRAVLHLWSLEATPPEDTTLASLEAAQTLGCGSVLHLVQALAQAGWRDAPRLWLVTRGAQAVGGESEVAVAQSPLWGLGKVIAHEHSELRCTTVDLSPVDTPDEVSSLFAEVWANDREDQVTLRGDARYVARLVRYSPGAVPAPSAGSSLAGRRPFDPETDQNFRLETSTPGMLDNLALRVAARQKPGPGEVEIRVCAAGLNFMDVMNALGLLPGDPLPLGAECAGTIVALGDGVEDLQVGDDVIAIAPFSFGAFVTVSDLFVVPKPAHLDFHEAATIPIAFLTAYYALHELGRLGEGERVLIHAAAGGVGLAAVQLAQCAGAEIFATAGTPEKREFLEDLGIQHVMDSRSLDFADEVLQLTDGRGVDVVLNSLAGEALHKSLSILAPYGRFLEIGKRDIHQNTPLGLRPFQNNLSFFAIDLDRVCRERPALIGSLFRTLLQHFEDGFLRPLPMQIVPISEIDNAFRFMAQARHTGKIVVAVQDQEVWVAPASEAPVSFRPDGTYLITGGLGSLGLVAARWMVQQGARHLVLMGRSEPSAAAQQEALEAMREAGAQVVVAKADVAREQQVARVLAEMDPSMPPLRGILHVAGMLDDGILLRLDQERFGSVMAPKVAGAWNLHTLSSKESLDFFVLFSSAASVLGSPGQGNYAAANAFLDALAHHRRAQGLPALSINWGPWAEVGLAARPDRGGRLALRGLASIGLEQGVEALGRVLGNGAAQVGVMPLDVRQWRQFYPKAAESPLLAQLVREQDDANGSGRRANSVRQALLAAEPGERRSLLERHLQQQIARVLRIPASRIEADTPLDALGLDSLMALELRNGLEAGLGLTLPATLVWGYPTLAALASHLAREMEIPLESIAEARSEPKDEGKDEGDEGDDEEMDGLLTETERLSEDEVQTALNEQIDQRAH
jgi:NADPH:quinone reductase-like Zn-dependent oxidoreductase/acyl carrier protein